MTALELDRLNPQNKFLKMKSLEDYPRKRTLLFKYYSSNNFENEIVSIYYKKGCGALYNKRWGPLFDLNDHYKIYGNPSFFSCKEPEKCIFRLANITEVLGLTLNILKYGK